MNFPYRRDIVGSAVSITTYEEVLDVMSRCVADDERIFICCTPASSLVFARDDAELRSALAAAAIVTPDGMGVVLAAKFLGEAISDRVYGPDLMGFHCDLAAKDGTPIYLYGGFDESTLAQLRDELTKRHPGLEIAGAWSPPHRTLTDAERANAIAEINASGAGVVWVGLGSPKQEVWMHELRDSLTPPVLVGVGAAFDFFAGRVSQAPRWMRRSGLEWLYRVLRDPHRLGRRYLLTLPRFAVLVVRQRIGL